MSNNSSSHQICDVRRGARAGACASACARTRRRLEEMRVVATSRGCPWPHTSTRCMPPWSHTGASPPSVALAGCCSAPDRGLAQRTFTLHLKCSLELAVPRWDLPPSGRLLGLATIFACEHYTRATSTQLSSVESVPPCQSRRHLSFHRDTRSSSSRVALPCLQWAIGIKEHGPADHHPHGIVPVTPAPTTGQPVGSCYAVLLFEHCPARHPRSRSTRFDFARSPLDVECL